MLNIQSSLVAGHQADLHSEAASARLARSASPAGADKSDSRRFLATMAARLSVAAADTARRLDPALDDRFDVRGSRAMGS